MRAIERQNPAKVAAALARAECDVNARAEAALRIPLHRACSFAGDSAAEVVGLLLSTGASADVPDAKRVTSAAPGKARLLTRCLQFH